MKNRLIHLILLLFVVAIDLFAQSNEPKKGFLTFSGVSIGNSNNNPWSRPKMGWYSDNPDTEIDYQTRYNNQASLMLSSTREKGVNAHFHFSNRDIVGKKIVFSGKYKYQQAQNAKISFSMTLDTFLRTVLTETIDVECNGSQNWKSFSVEMPFERTGEFYFRIVGAGDINFWISDCQVLVDGQSFDIMVDPTAEVDKDVEFAEQSGISITAPSGQTLENLEVLGKVWGFLKYFHPQVVTGKYNWDFELFRVLPTIANAKNKKERNLLLYKWIDKYGEITEAEDYTVKDSTQYHRFAYLNWLEDPNLFDNNLSAKLVKIKNAKRNSVFNYYLIPLSWKEEVEFTRDKPYSTVSWKDQGYRILTLYRLWNAIEYCFPYTNYTDNKWSTLLDKYLPEFMETPSKEALDRSVQKLATEINDSHGSVELSRYEPPMRGLPMSLVQTVDGRLAVESTRLQEINRGSVILAVKGKPVSEIIEDYRSILPSSNEKGVIRNVTHKLFLTEELTTEVTIEYQKETYNPTVPTQTYTRDAHVERKKPEEYRLEEKNIIYMDMGEISPEELENKMKNSADAKGLVLDLRKYPRGYTKDLFEKYLYPKPTPYMWFSMNSKKYPGNFFLDIKGDVGLKKNPDYFKGKIAILVSETTQSLGELSAIAYRVAPQSAVIGTQTAGANGHIGYLYLPRGIKFNYTMAGAFYPNWGMNQRVGVKIDIPVEQTVEDVEAGEDMWIKKAIEYIENEE